MGEETAQWTRASTVDLPVRMCQTVGDDAHRVVTSGIDDKINTLGDGDRVQA
jgi:hypothetical protein